MKFYLNQINNVNKIIKKNPSFQLDPAPAGEMRSLIRQDWNYN